MSRGLLALGAFLPSEALAYRFLPIGSSLRECLGITSLEITLLEIIFLEVLES